MRTKIACLSSLLIALALPAAAHADGGPVLGPSYGDLGVTGPPGTAGAQFRYVAGPAPRGTALVKVATADGRVATWRFFDRLWAPPSVTLNGDTGGLAADGKTLVLTTSTFATRRPTSQFLVLDTDRLRITDHIKLDGYFGFDAISPDGRLLYLVDYENPLKDPLDYRVRAYDLADGHFRPGEIVDPEEPDEQMAGQPLAREYSSDGRWAYTLYGGGEETFIHALDTQDATAVCVDLPDLNVNGNGFFRMGLDVAPNGGPITVTQKGEPVETVAQGSFAVSEPGSAATVPAPGDDDGNDFGLWLVIGGGAVLVALAAIGLRRRRAGELDTAELERMVADAEPADESREREPVP
jgi:hypothetical protein